MGLWLRHLSGLPIAGRRFCEVEGRMLTKDNLETRRVAEGIVFLILFTLTIPAAAIIAWVCLSFSAPPPCCRRSRMRWSR